METIAERFKRCREAVHKSQEQVANALNMSRSTFARREAEGDFSSKILEEMARMYSVNVEYLICGDKNDSVSDKIAFSFENSETKVPLRAESPKPFFLNENETFEDLTPNEKNKLRIIRNLSPEDYKEHEKFLEERQKK